MVFKNECHFSITPVSVCSIDCKVNIFRKWFTSVSYLPGVTVVSTLRGVNTHVHIYVHVYLVTGYTGTTV